MRFGTLVKIMRDVKIGLTVLRNDFEVFLWWFWSFRVALCEILNLIKFCQMPNYTTEKSLLLRARNCGVTNHILNLILIKTDLGTQIFFQAEIQIECWLIHSLSTSAIGKRGIRDIFHEVCRHWRDIATVIRNMAYFTRLPVILDICLIQFSFAGQKNLKSSISAEKILPIWLQQFMIDNLKFELAECPISCFTFPK